MTKKTYTSPNWYKETAPADSYRSLFKWGSLSEFKHPNKGLVEHMKKTFSSYGCRLPRTPPGRIGKSGY